MNTATAFETVIIGGGLAGLTCGLRLAQQGVRVAILETGETDRYMCNSRICGGAFHVSYRDVAEPADVLLKAMNSKTQGFLRPSFLQEKTRLQHRKGFRAARGGGRGATGDRGESQAHQGNRFAHVHCTGEKESPCAIITLAVAACSRYTSTTLTKVVMQLTIAEANELAIHALSRAGMTADNARITAEHLVDAALCGHEFSSLPRVIALAEAIRNKPPAGETRVVRENHCSALIDGGDNVAYVVSLHAIDKAIEIARKNGVAVVCANNTWFSGRLAYYVERAARQGFIALHTTNATARVAPFGGVDRLMGTNPFAIAFPSEDDPLVIDIGTSQTTWGDVELARTKGKPLPEGVAVNPAGYRTTDPDEALEGAILAWGGPRGSGLALAVQLLGILAGSDLVIDDVSNYGLFFMVIHPKLFMPSDQFPARVSAFRQVIAANRPVAGGSAVRVPGDRSQQLRRENRIKGMISLDEKVYARLCELADNQS